MQETNSFQTHRVKRRRVAGRLLLEEAFALAHDCNEPELERARATEQHRHEQRLDEEATEGQIHCKSATTRLFLLRYNSQNTTRAPSAIRARLMN